MKDIYSIYNINESIMDDDDSIETNPELIKQLVHSWMQSNKIGALSLQKDGTITIPGKHSGQSVTITGEIPGYIKLNEYEGSMLVTDMSDLSKLPKIKGKLSIKHCNQLKDLEGCPEVEGELVVSYNANLQSLKGCPKNIDSLITMNNKQKFSWNDIKHVCKAQKSKCVWEA